MDNHLSKKLCMQVAVPTKPRNKPLHIFDLPREVRNMIWGFLVVVPKIFVAGIADPSRGPKPQPVDTLEYRLARHLYCSTREGMYIAACQPHKDLEHPDLRFFLVCHQIYDEAMPVYYSQNNFLFRMDIQKPDPSNMRRTRDFLRQRPAPALQHIRHIELDLTESTGYPRGVLRDFVDSHTDLVDFIKGHMSIQHLTLHIHIGHEQRIFVRWSQRKHLIELCKIPKLQRLTVKLNVFAPQCNSHIESSCFDTANMCHRAAVIIRGAQVIENLRSRMLENGANLGSKMIRAQMATTHHPSGHGLYNNLLLFEADNNSEGKCLLPVLDGSEYADTYKNAPFTLEPDDLGGVLRNMDQQQCVELQQSARKVGSDRWDALKDLGEEWPDNFTGEDGVWNLGEDGSWVDIDDEDAFFAELVDEHVELRWHRI